MEFEFNFDDIDFDNIQSGARDIDTLVSDFIIPKLELILSKKFGQRGFKSDVNIMSNRINFACPYCGDSETNQNRKRGNIYYKNMNFKCFNCEMSRSLKKFFEDWLDLNSSDEIELQVVMNNAHKINKSHFRYFDTCMDLQKYFKYSIDREVLKETYGLIEIKNSPKHLEYLKTRYLDNYLDYFLSNPKLDQIYVLNIAAKEQVISCAIRNLWKKSKNKYIIKDAEELYEEIGLDIPDAEEFKIFLNLSRVFNLFRVDFDKTVTIFEGQMDSLLYPNSIAMSGGNKSLPIDMELFRYLLDNDKTGIKNSVTQIGEGHEVFLWKKVLQDYNIIRPVKDFNEFYIIMKKKGLNVNYLELNKYFSKDEFNIEYL